MSKYERIRREIIAVEREIAILECCIQKPDEKESLNNICEKKQRIRESFAAVDCPTMVSVS